MNENESKTKNGLIVVLVLIILLLAGALVFVLLNKDNDTKESSNDKTDVKNVEEIVTISEEEATKLVGKYVQHSCTVDANTVITDISDEQKVFITYKNLLEDKKNKDNCLNIYANSSNAKLEDEGYYTIYENEKSIGWCSFEEKLEIVSYDDFNNEYKKLFGKAMNVSKTKHFIDTLQLAYHEETNSFVKLSCHCGCADPTLYLFDVKNINQDNNTLTIEIGYFELFPNVDNTEYVYEKTNATYSSSDVESAGFNSRFVEENIVDSYRYVFNKEDNNYVFVSKTKI